MTAEQVRQVTPDQPAGFDLAITSYGTLLRMPALAEMRWRFVILDEAQAIKNPNAKQTRAAKALKADARIALTGTPVENHLGDLWSIFDFINPGLLGTARQFSSYAKGLAERDAQPLRAAAGIGAPLYPAADEDGQIRHRRPAGQDRDHGPLHSQPQAGRALCPDGVRSGRSAGRVRRDPAQGHRAGDADAAETDLQSPLAVAERQRLGRGRQRQTGPPAGDRRGRGGAAGEDAGLHAVPRDDGAAGDVSLPGFSAGPVWCCTAARR